MIDKIRNDLKHLRNTNEHDIEYIAEEGHNQSEFQSSIKIFCKCTMDIL